MPNERILVAEDSPTQAEGLKLILESEGFEVDVAPDGRVALETVRARAIDLVLTDVTMPELDGYALCSAMREDPATHDVPLVILSALDDPSALVRGLEVGIDGWLRKPIDIDDLTRVVGGVLRRNGRRRERDRALAQLVTELRAQLEAESHVHDLLARMGRLVGHRDG